jgi:hypothetical protein
MLIVALTPRPPSPPDQLTWRSVNPFRPETVSCLTGDTTGHRAGHPDIRPSAREPRTAWSSLRVATTNAGWLSFSRSLLGVIGRWSADCQCDARQPAGDIPGLSRSRSDFFGGRPKDRPLVYSLSGTHQRNSKPGASVGHRAFKIWCQRRRHVFHRPGEREGA